jgi:AcrR family transcriptional regulator
MSGSTTRKKRKRRTREALPSAALRCVAGEGCTAGSTSAIAAGAGVAHGTIDVHFASKEALLDELLADFNGAPWPGARSLHGPESTGPGSSRWSTSRLRHSDE